MRRFRFVGCKVRFRPLEVAVALPVGSSRSQGMRSGRTLPSRVRMPSSEASLAYGMVDLTPDL
jgi:hypothetical protein